MPRTVIAGNWKMNKTAAETREFFHAFLPLAERLGTHAEIVIAPPFTALAAAHECLRGTTRVKLGAQNVNWERYGAFTGEIAIPMLAEFGVRYVIVGHSERRQFFHESDAMVNLKVQSLLAGGMTPIVAVGETAAERAAGATDDLIVRQTQSALDGLSGDDVAQVVMAYEPVWAIGTGANCDPAEANRVMALIRSCMRGLEDVPILYGGSVKPDNVHAYREQPSVNGGLIGGASLDPASFVRLIEAAVHG